MTLVDTAIVVLVATVLGSVGIYAGVRLLVDDAIEPINGAALGLLGAVVWGVVSLLVTLPVVGPVSALVVWTGLVGARYPCGWPAASALGFVVWVVPTGVLYFLSTLGVVSFVAVGVPVVYLGG